MKNSKAKVAKVVLEVAGKELHLTVDQAKELQELLNNTFGKDRLVYGNYWYPYSYGSVSVSTAQNNLEPPYVVTCNSVNVSAGGNFVLSSSSGSTATFSDNVLNLKAAA